MALAPQSRNLVTTGAVASVVKVMSRNLEDTQTDFEAQVPPDNPAGPGPRGWTHRHKTSEEWQQAQWRIRPRCEDWPDRMDVYLAAAYLQMSYYTVRKLCVRDRTGRATLPHQRIGSSYRFSRADLDRLGAVAGRD